MLSRKSKNYNHSPNRIDSHRALRKKAFIVLLSIIVNTAIIGCGKQTISGTYVYPDRSLSVLEITFKPDGTYTSSWMGGGTYTIEGDTILLGGVIPVIYEGDRLGMYKEGKRAFDFVKK